jgi:hypothetical protein
MKKTQIQQQQYISGMMKNIPSAEPVKRYAERVQVIDSINLAYEKDLEDAIGEDKEILTRCHTEAWKVVWQRAKFFRNGGKAYRSTTKKGNVSQISPAKYNSLNDKQKAKWEMIVRDGQGQSLDAQKLVDMYLAARTAYIAGYKTLAGKEIEPGIKAASSAAASEMRRSLQLPCFEDVAKAERFHEKAWKLIREDLQHSCDQHDTEYFSRKMMAKMLAGCRLRLQAFYSQRFTDGRSWNAYEKSSKLLRKVAASICNGTFSAPENGSSERKALDKLSEIMRKALLPMDLQDLGKKPAKDSKPLKVSGLQKTFILKMGWAQTTAAMTLARRLPSVAAKLK